MTEENEDQASRLVGRFLVFYQNAMPRTPVYLERCAYEVTGVIGKKKMTIRLAHGEEEEGVQRTACLNGPHIAAIFPTKEQAAKAVALSSEAKAKVRAIETSVILELSKLTEEPKKEAPARPRPRPRVRK